jgi:hypothetical protein
VKGHSRTNGALPGPHGLQKDKEEQTTARGKYIWPQAGAKAATMYLCAWLRDKVARPEAGQGDEMEGEWHNGTMNCWDFHRGSTFSASFTGDTLGADGVHEAEEHAPSVSCRSSDTVVRPMARVRA